MAVDDAHDLDPTRDRHPVDDQVGPTRQSTDAAAEVFADPPHPWDRGHKLTACTDGGDLPAGGLGVLSGDVALDLAEVLSGLWQVERASHSSSAGRSPRSSSHMASSSSSLSGGPDSRPCCTIRRSPSVSSSPF